MFKFKLSGVPTRVYHLVQAWIVEQRIKDLDLQTLTQPTVTTVIFI